MANNVSTTPYSFTAFMPKTFHGTSGSTPATGPINIQSVVWVSPVKVGDEATITDGYGKTLLHIVASADDVANGEVTATLLGSTVVKDFQLITLTSGTLYVNTNVVTASGGTVTTKGTAVAAGTAQAQNPIALTGASPNSAVAWALPNVPPASWQTGIQVVFVVANDTVTPYLVNPTAGSITPVAQALNVRVIN